MGRRRKCPSDRQFGVLGYIRVSTASQADSGLGLAAQRAAIEEECERRGVPLLGIREDAGASGKSLDRPGLTALLCDLDDGAASILMVAKLDRLSRSVRDAAELLERSERRGWKIVALDLGVDTTTPAGEAMANLMATFGQLERRLIGQRTREALAERKAQGVRLGRPPSLPTDVRERILAAYLAGGTWTAIARDLNDEGVPTAQGGAKWYPATVRSIVIAAGVEAAQ